MLNGNAPLQLSSFYRTQLTFSRSQTAVGGQTSCFSFLWNAYSRIVKMEIDQQLEQHQVSCETGQEWPRNPSNVAAGLWSVL